MGGGGGAGAAQPCCRLAVLPARNSLRHDGCRGKRQLARAALHAASCRVHGHNSRAIRSPHGWLVACRALAATRKSAAIYTAAGAVPWSRVDRSTSASACCRPASLPGHVSVVSAERCLGGLPLRPTPHTPPLPRMRFNGRFTARCLPPVRTAHVRMQPPGDSCSAPQGQGVNGFTIVTATTKTFMVRGRPLCNMCVRVCVCSCMGVCVQATGVGHTPAIAPFWPMRGWPRGRCTFPFPPPPSPPPLAVFTPRAVPPAAVDDLPPTPARCHLHGSPSTVATVPPTCQLPLPALVSPVHPTPSLATCCTCLPTAAAVGPRVAAGHASQQ